MDMLDQAELSAPLTRQASVGSVDSSAELFPVWRPYTYSASSGESFVSGSFWSPSPRNYEWSAQLLLIAGKSWRNFISFRTCQETFSGLASSMLLQPSLCSTRLRIRRLPSTASPGHSPCLARCQTCLARPRSTRGRVGAPTPAARAVPPHLHSGSSPRTHARG